MDKNYRRLKTDSIYRLKTLVYFGLKEEIGRAEQLLSGNRDKGEEDFDGKDLKKKLEELHPIFLKMISEERVPGFLLSLLTPSLSLSTSHDPPPLFQVSEMMQLESHATMICRTQGLVIFVEVIFLIGVSIVERFFGGGGGWGGGFYYFVLVSDI